MHLKILGTRGNVGLSAPYHSKHSGVMIDDKILLDAGEAEFLENEPDLALITHMHPDHAFFADSEIRLSDHISKKSKVFAPGKAGTGMVREISAGWEKEFRAYNIRALDAVHSQNVSSLAYLVWKKEGGSSKKVLYTGDIVSLSDEFEKVNLVITDGSFFRKGGLVRKTRKGEPYGHAGIPDLMEMFADKTEKMLFMHFGSWFYRDIESSRRKIQNLADEKGITALVGYDGMELEV
jgi:ribonuclease BN (tRNA processing enzyme)